MSGFEEFEQLTDRARDESLAEIDIVDAVMERVAGASAPATERAASSTRFRSFGVRWTVAALVCFVVIWCGIPDQSEAEQALAAVQKARDSLSIDGDRTYDISVEGRSPRGAARRRKAKLYARGNNAFVLEFQGPFDTQILAGSDGKESWFIPPVGPVIVDSDSKRVDRLLGQQPAPIPVLHLDEILDRLEKRYDLRLAVSANDDTDWTHIIGHKRNTEAFEPETVNLWTDPASGLLYRLELDWSKSDSERPGPHHISVRLTGQDSLAPDFFRHESHHNEHRPVQPSLPQFTE